MVSKGARLCLVNMRLDGGRALFATDPETTLLLRSVTVQNCRDSTFIRAGALMDASLWTSFQNNVGGLGCAINAQDTGTKVACRDCEFQGNNCNNWGTVSLLNGVHTTWMRTRWLSNTAAARGVSSFAHLTIPSFLSLVPLIFGLLHT